MTERILFSFLLLMAPCGNSLDCYGQGKQEIKIAGKVIAYDEFLNVTGAPQSQCLIVKVTRRLEGGEESEYIKVVYEALHGQSGLPKEMESSKAEWVFTLRSGTDDEACHEPVTRWIRTRPQARVGLPDTEKLVCYFLGPTGFTPFKRF